MIPEASMFDADELRELREQILSQVDADRHLLDELVADVRVLHGGVKRILPRSTTAVALVASDGGNNRLVFDPFYAQLIRVTDSYGKRLFLDVVSPTTDTDELSHRQFHASGEPRTALGRMMRDLQIRNLDYLSHMLPSGKQQREDPDSVKPSWVLIYRDLCEWAVLYDRICYTTFGTDTLLIRDGLLRSKIFRGDLFVALRKRIEEAITEAWRSDRRRIYLVGIAKHSKVLDRYALAIATEELFPAGDARYVSVPREMEGKAYERSEYAWGSRSDDADGGAPKFIAGDMYFVRFGPQTVDPIWPVDILSSQADRAAEIFGYLLADARDGFPVPYYPRCLQRAHEQAQVVDFDLAILQDQIFSAVRHLLPEDKREILDALQLKTDAAARRYE
jgi:hypothetical protein